MKKRKKSKCRPLRRLIYAVDLPEFVAGRDECIEIRGGNTVLVEGAQGVHTYEEELVKIRMKNYLLVLRGQGFDLSRFGEGCLQVVGKLHQLEWED